MSYSSSFVVEVDQSVFFPQQAGSVLTAPVYAGAKEATTVNPLATALAPPDGCHRLITSLQDFSHNLTKISLWKAPKSVSQLIISLLPRRFLMFQVLYGVSQRPRAVWV